MGREHITTHLQMVTASMPTTMCAFAYGVMTKLMVLASFASATMVWCTLKDSFVGKILSIMTREIPVENKWTSWYIYKREILL
jgi:hypothetical protein